MKKLLLALLFLTGCTGPGPVYRIGVDPELPESDFKKRDYILGYVQELLLKMSKRENIQFEVVQVGGMGLLDELKSEKLDAAISSISPHNFNESTYDFSEGFLKLGPVLVLNQKSPTRNLKDLDGKVVGLLMEDPSILIVENYPKVITRSYETLRDLFKALSERQIDALIVGRIDAISFMGKEMKIEGEPLNDRSLRFITNHEQNRRLMSSFDRVISRLTKESKLRSLQKKWSLD